MTTLSSKIAAFEFVLIIALGLGLYKTGSMYLESQAEVQRLETVVEKMQKDYDEAKKKYDHVLQQNNKLSVDLAETKGKLDMAKSRQEVVFKKPGLVENMINKSFDEFEKDMACVTGLYTVCQ